MENDSKALVIGTELDTVKCLKLPSAVMDKAQECSFHDNILKKTVWGNSATQLKNSTETYLSLENETLKTKLATSGGKVSKLAEQIDETNFLESNAQKWINDLEQYTFCNNDRAVLVYSSLSLFIHSLNRNSLGNDSKHC